MEHDPKRSAAYFLNPIRLSGLLGIFFLLVPGSLLGVSLLLAYTGASFPIAARPPELHAMFQLTGFFMVLIWGFLAHGFPGMLGGNHEHTRTIHRPLITMGLVLVSIWMAQWLPAPVWLFLLLLGAGLFSSLWVTWMLASVLTDAKRSWLQIPLPLLIVPLLLSPLYWLLLGGAQMGYIRPVMASDFLLFAIVLPIILTMSYRMLSAMAGMIFPRDPWFIGASWLWAVGAALWLLSHMVHGAALGPLGTVLLLAGAVGFSHGLGVLSARRTDGKKAQLQAIDRALILYVRMGFVFWVCGQALFFLASLGVLPGIQPYWVDVARHYVVVGFAFALVAGITQRVFPTFLRGRRSSPIWMQVNLWLVVGGLLFRLGEPFLPDTQVLVRVSAAMLYAGVFGYAVHLLRGMLLPSTDMMSPVERIRKAATPSGADP